MKAYVLISLSGKHEREMLEKLKDMTEVRSVYLLFGEWDMIAEISAENPDAFAAFVIDKIRSNPEVKLTSSLIVAGK
jgi:DNA-binding Lrp family transcriptional regulator